jgi:hypothetical protein
MGTLTEIEAAAAGLSASKKSRLLLFLAAQLRAEGAPPPEPRRFTKDRTPLDNLMSSNNLALGAGNICWECSSYASTPSFDLVHIYFFRNSTRGSRSNRKNRCGDECEHEKTGGGTHCSLQQN